MPTGSIQVDTDRLLLDPLTVADLPVVHGEWGLPAIARMTATISPEWDEQTARAWLLPRVDPESAGYGAAIRRKSDRRLIGSVGMGGTPVNLGYLLAQPFWGQGYATEAVRAFLGAAYAMSSELDVIEAGVFDDNPASAGVLSKIGFLRVGPSDCTSLARVEPAANSLYRLTRTVFEATR